MLKKYFSEEVLNYESALDIFKSELIEKYGEDIGNEINDNRDIIQKEDVLSNQPYFYNKMFHSISTTKGNNIITETLINSPTKNNNKIV